MDRRYLTNTRQLNRTFRFRSDIVSASSHMILAYRNNNRITTKYMLDLKTMKSALEQLESERGISKEKIIDAIEAALAAAYKKDYGKKGQIVRASFDANSGGVEFWQVKIVVDRDQVIMEGDGEAGHEELKDAAVEDIKIRYNPEQHMLIEDAKRIKRDAQIGDELIFPLEAKADFGRIAAQAAKDAK